MSLRIISTGIHFHPGSEPFFAITSEEHPQGAWVIAQDQNRQQEFYDTARSSLTGGFGGIGSVPIAVECERYEDSGDARRFYWGVTDVRWAGIGLRDERRLRSLPPLTLVIGKNAAPVSSPDQHHK